MAVKITDICISCGSCIDECPVSAIVDDADNPTGEDAYYVYADKCVECVGFNDEPACAYACLSDRRMHRMGRALRRATVSYRHRRRYENGRNRYHTLSAKFKPFCRAYFEI